MLRPTDNADGTGRWCAAPEGTDPTWVSPRRPSLSLRLWVSYSPMTRAHVRLLGPCFKTGRVECRQIRHRPKATPAVPIRPRERSSGTVASPCQSNSPGRPGSLKATVVPRPHDGPPRRSVTAPAETDAYLPTGLLTVTKPIVALCPRKVHTAEPGATPRTGPRDPEPQQPRAARRAEFRGPTLRIHPFTSGRFHVLLNSLFKVLFNFPSRYLSAIGLVPVFSLRWSLPPTLGCIPKQPDS